MAGSTAERSPREPGALRVLRVSHSSVVTAWRSRERELRRRGVEVRLLSAARWEEGGAVVRLESAGDDFVRPVATFGRHPNLFVYDPRPLWRELGDSLWDVLDLHEEPFALATAEVLLLRRLRRRRMPYVLYSAQNLDKRYPPPFRWLERWSLRGASGAYPANEETARILRSKGLRGPAVVVPLGVDLERFSPAARPAPEGRLRVGFVGRLVPQKGVEVLLRAAARDPRLDLVVVGGGPEEARLRELAVELGLGGRAAFCGPVDEASTPEVYRSLDALAVPSLPTGSWVEQFGRVVVEAQASGVPVVASRSGALPEVVGEAGALVEPGDPDELARGLLRLLEEPGRWESDRLAGLAAAAARSWERVAEAQLALYRSAAGAC